jgi:hypothetical protein
MSVSPAYLEATVIAAAVAREHRDLEVFVNISQMTVSQMTLTKMTESPQHRQHLLGESLLNWSGVPIVHVRPTVSSKNLCSWLGGTFDRARWHHSSAIRLRTHLSNSRS